MKEAGIRRRRGVQNGDAMGGRLLEGLDDVAYDAADFVVAVRGVEHLCGRGDRGCRGKREPEAVKRGLDRAVSASYAGEAGDDDQLGALGQSIRKPCLGLGQILWQVEHELAQLGSELRSCGDQRGRLIEQVGRVVVVAAGRVRGFVVQSNE